MQLNFVEDFEGYVTRIRESPEEARALADDLLITVTSFFRDNESFEAIKSKVFPRLLKNRSRNDPMRLWTVGCSTGQEAYSLANFRGGVEGRYLFAEAWIRNAFDTNYIPVAFAFPSQSGFLGESGRPRTYGITAGVKF